MKLKKVSVIALILTLCTIFNAFASMNTDPRKPVPSTPFTEEYDNWKWVWINDALCVRFDANESVKIATLQRQYESGVIRHWYDSERSELKNRDTYAGKWSQDADGIWSFEFDDKTIPVGITKIDDVLYAFNGVGQLKEGYEYYSGVKTAADGLASCQDAEFVTWLATQYVPACTSHE